MSTDSSSTPEASSGDIPDASYEQTQTPDSPDAPDETGSSTERAPKYREKLELAERARDAYRAALEPHARSAVEREIGDRLADPSSIWLLPDVELWSLMDDELAADPAKITAAVDRLLSHAPSLGKRSSGSADGGARGSRVEPSTSWAQVVKGR